MSCCEHPTTNARKLRNPRPLRVDPTRTGMIRKRFEADIKRRFRKLDDQIWEFLVTLDALGLKDRKSFIALNSKNPSVDPSFESKRPINDSPKDTPHPTINIQPRQYEFLTDANKLTAFNEWLRQQMDAGILSFIPSDKGAGPIGPWTTGYIESAYKKGLLNAYLSARSEQLDLFPDEQSRQITQEQFLRDSFNQPETLSKVQLLATRTFEQLKGVTSSMGSNLNRILSQGMIDGKGVEEIAREISSSITKIRNSRAIVIAHTELIHAHAEGQLDSFKALGVEELGVKAEFSTARDDRVCPICAALEGKIYTIAKARGLIPLHPRCVLGDSVIESQEIFALTRAKYFGKIVHIVTASGRRFSVTENHILLTDSGWRFAKELCNRDYFINANSIDSSFGENPNKDKGIPSILDAFESFAELFPENFGRIPWASPQDFHGDGNSIKEEIDIVISDSELRNKFYASDVAKFKKFALVSGDIGRRESVLLQGFGSSYLNLNRLADTSDSIVSRLTVAPILSRSPFGHHQPIGVSLPTQFYASEFEPVVDTTSGTPKTFRDAVYTLSSRVSFDQIIKIEIEETGGRGIPVFDVSTHSSIYSLNGILSSNCRCTWRPYIPKSAKKGKFK